MLWHRALLTLERLPVSRDSKRSPESRLFKCTHQSTPYTLHHLYDRAKPLSPWHNDPRARSLATESTRIIQTSQSWTGNPANPASPIASHKNHDKGSRPCFPLVTDSGASPCDPVWLPWLLFLGICELQVLLPSWPSRPSVCLTLSD